MGLKARFVATATFLLLAHPRLAHADGLAGLVTTSSWLLIWIWQLYYFTRIMRLKKFESRRLLMGLAYALMLGLTWWIVVFGFQENLQRVLDRENREFHVRISPSFEERQQYQYKAFEEKFGSDLAVLLYPLFIFGMPIALAPLTVWLLNRILGSNKGVENHY